MKLIPQERRDYRMLWKCAACAKWNSKGVNECLQCGQTEPMHPEESLPKQRLIQILEVALEYAHDHGLATCADPVLRAAIIAYGTNTEGYLASLCSGFGGLHAHYALDGNNHG
jgi:hypothetical protein